MANVEDVIELDCDEDIADMFYPWSHPSTAMQLSYYQSREVVDMEWEKVGSMVTEIRSKGLRVSDNLLESWGRESWVNILHFAVTPPPPGRNLRILGRFRKLFENFIKMSLKSLFLIRFSFDFSKLSIIFASNVLKCQSVSQHLQGIIKHFHGRGY